MVSGLRKSKKGAYFFVLDALIGIMIFVTTIFIISGFNTVETGNSGIIQQIDLLSSDLYETQLKDVDASSDYFFNLRQDITYYSPYYTIDEFAYLLHLEGNTSVATSMIDNVTSWLPQTFGMNYSINNGTDTITLFIRNSTITTYEHSRSKLVREKVTLLGSNVTNYRPPVFTSVVIWR